MKKHPITWERITQIAPTIGMIMTTIGTIVTVVTLLFIKSELDMTAYQMEKSYEPYLVLRSKTFSHYWPREESYIDEEIRLELLNIGSGVATEIRVDFDFIALDEFIQSLKTAYGNDLYDFSRGSDAADDSDDILKLDGEIYRNSGDTQFVYYRDTSVFKREFLLSGVENADSVALPFFYTLTINHMIEKDTTMRTLTSKIAETPIIVYVSFGDILHGGNDYYKYKMQLYVEFPLYAPSAEGGTVEYRFVLKEIDRGNQN